MSLRIIAFLVSSFFPSALLFAQANPAANANCNLTLKLKPLESSSDRLIQSLLKLSLSKVEQHACFVHDNEVFTDLRTTRSVANGDMSLKWASASHNVTSELRAIPIPIFKGLMGYRILVIKNGNQAFFEDIDSLESAKRMRVGLGSSWGDLAIFQHAGFHVETAQRGRLLWNMLIKERFDALPLELHAPWQHLEKFPGKLAVEEHLLIHYPMSLHFFVNKRDDHLYQLIKKGMEIAIQDGSYDTLLYQSKVMRITAEKTNIQNRKIIKLNNPEYPFTNSLARKAYWLDPSKLAEDVRRAQAQKETP